jgi:hypothetical protein
LRKLRIAAVWAAAVAVTLVGAWRLEIGPTLVSFDSRHGVHVGDLVLAALCALVALAVTSQLP